MKNINKILSISVALFVLLFTSCTEELPEREPSPETAPGTAQVYFPSANETSLELDEDATSVTVTIARGNTSGAITVPLTVLKNDSSIFSIPESVSFADGEAEATFTVTFSGAIPAVDYTFEVVVEGDEYIDAYTVVDGDPAIAVTVTLLKWVKFATGTYEKVLLGSSETIDLYRAEGSNKYRFYDLWAEGIDWDFQWDGGASITPSGEIVSGYYYTETGLVVEGYGEIIALTDGDTDYTFYDSESGSFRFDRYWIPEIGDDIGWAEDYFTITELY